MTPQELSFIHSRRPRATGLSDEAIDEHKELIRDLYLKDDCTRDEVISHLKSKFGFVLSPDQFSKATRRWGFYKQRCGHGELARWTEKPAGRLMVSSSDVAGGGPSHESKPDELFDQEPIMEHESSKRTRSVVSSISSGSDDPAARRYSPSLRRPVKRARPRSDLNVATNEDCLSQTHEVADSGGFAPTALHEAGNIETMSGSHFADVNELSAEYLACCYRYNQAFDCYLKASVPFLHQTTSDKQRRARILDMARTAKSRHNREIVRVMMEFELKTSNDPLSRVRSRHDPVGKTEICRTQSFLFHRHLAYTYACKGDHTIQADEHLGAAQSFTMSYDRFGPPPIDLWALLRLRSWVDTCHVPDNLLDSLECNEKLLVSDMKDCLVRCRKVLLRHGHLSALDSSLETSSKLFETMTPVAMSYWRLGQDRSLMWKNSGPLFSFLWKSMHLGQRPPSGWGQSFDSISETQFLMIVCRMIGSKYYWFCDSRQEQKDVVNRTTLDPILAETRHYCAAIDALLSDHQTSPREVKWEFAKQFVEHHSWSPPASCTSAQAEQIQDYQLEALESVLAAYKRDIPITTISTTLRELTSLKERDKDTDCGTSDDFISWLREEEQRLNPTERPGSVIRAQDHGILPSFTASSRSSISAVSSSAHRLYLSVLRGNPTMARLLTSHSSRSSRVSVSSSFWRFKAAAHHNGSHSEPGSTPASTLLKDKYHPAEVWLESDDQYFMPIPYDSSETLAEDDIAL